MPTDSNLLSWIRKGLEAPGKTQRGLARAIAVDPASVTRMLQGLRSLKPEEIAASREAHSADAKRDAGLQFVQTLVVQRGIVSDQEVNKVKAAGFSDGDIAELIANVAVNIFTNYFNHVARTVVDFPQVPVAMEAARA